MPRDGVYAVWAVADGERVGAVANLALRADESGAIERYLEVHVLERETALHGESTQVLSSVGYATTGASRRAGTFRNRSPATWWRRGRAARGDGRGLNSVECAAFISERLTTCFLDLPGFRDDRRWLRLAG